MTKTRVDFFKPGSGKWVSTFEVEMKDYYDETLTQEALTKAIKADNRCSDFLESYDAVCLEPYHVNAHPVMLKVEPKH